MLVYFPLRLSMLCIFYYGEYQLPLLWLLTNSNKLRDFLAVIISMVLLLYLLYLRLSKMTILRVKRHHEVLV